VEAELFDELRLITNAADVVEAEAELDAESHRAWLARRPGRVISRSPRHPPTAGSSSRTLSRDEIHRHRNTDPNDPSAQLTAYVDPDYLHSRLTPRFTVTDNLIGQVSYIGIYSPARKTGVGTFRAHDMVHCD
jgi:hypothetical protein